MHDLASTTKDVEGMIARRRELEDLERREQSAIAVLRLQVQAKDVELAARSAEVETHRRNLSQKDGELTRALDRIAAQIDDFKTALAAVSVSLAAGLVKVFLPGGSSSYGKGDRLVCLGPETVRIFDIQSSTIEYENRFTDIRATKTRTDSDLTISLTNMKEELICQISIPITESAKWEWAIDKSTDYNTNRSIAMTVVEEDTQREAKRMPQLSRQDSRKESPRSSDEDEGLESELSEEDHEV